MIEDTSTGTEGSQEDTSSDMSYDMNPTILPDEDLHQEDEQQVAPTPTAQAAPPSTNDGDKNGDDAGGLSLELEDDKTTAPAPTPDAAPAPPVEGDPADMDMNMDMAPQEPALSTEEQAAKDIADEETAANNRLPLGEKLVAAGIIDRDKLSVALQQKKQTPDRMIGEILVDLGFVTADELSSILAESAGFETFRPGGVMYDADILEMVPKKDALKFNILPISLDKDTNTALVAMVDPYDVVAMDKLRRLLPKGCNIEPQMCSPGVLAEAIDEAYGYATSVEGILKELSGENVDNIDLDDISEETNYSHPIVRLVNALVLNGVKQGASDLHFEPEENFVRVRYRMDGVLRSSYILHKEYWDAIAQRLKIMSGMNIADKLMPQDGRFGINAVGREADFRVSCLPTVHGENIVLRVLDKSSGIVPLEKLGFSEHNLALINKAQSRPEGIIIITGPTGSGKTTSLYSMLNEANRVDVNIMTLEDPVEFALPMIRQTNVREGAGLSFADGVKALLRQDPDIIFVGEVRDEVTAEQALKAAMTGHQVYTSLHTNDCFGAIPRLLDMKLKPAMLAGAIIASFAQRLVRTLCPDCKEERTATEDECRLMDVDKNNPPQIFHPKGCPKCENSGYTGRTAVVEILFLDEDLNDLIAQNAHKAELKAMAREKGFKSMLDDGIVKILEGKTSLEAVMKVVDFSNRL